MRAVASACVLAKFRGVSVTIIWDPAEDCNIRFTDVFMPTARVNIVEGQDGVDIIEQVKNGTYFYNPQVHTNCVLKSVDTPHTVETLIVCGGHEYKDPTMSEASFINAKNEVYASLVPNEEIEGAIRKWQVSRAVCVQDLVGIHLRLYEDRFDSDDTNEFQKECTATIVDTLTTIRSVGYEGCFLACNNTEVTHALINATGEKLVTYVGVSEETADRSKKESMKQSVIEFVLLSRCRYIIGTYSSSFSDEAALFGDISMKICANMQASSEPYHSYGHVVYMGRNVICPDTNQICEFLS
jgi:hypothetical protein